jgi:hypothetical protein
MSTAATFACVLLIVSVGAARAQAPTGVIAGVAMDSSGASLVGMEVQFVNRETGSRRMVTTAADGHFAAEALLPGEYQVSVEAAGFKRLERTAVVEAGSTTTMDLVLQVGDVNETVVVVGATPQLDHDHHQVDGLVGRAQIDSLPLNGRNFLELAKLEPGVTSYVRLNDNRAFVSILGAGLQTIPRVGYTRVTIDGGNIVTPGTAGVLFQVSQDVVQEFQLSSVNFDLATSLATNGAINIVTRSGGNDHRGGGFLFHRDHHLAAYPGLERDPSNPHPEFRRDQFGFEIGGPIRTDRAFFAGGYERHDQRGVVSIQPRTPQFAPLGGIFSTPYTGDLFNARADVRLNANHSVFGRYTLDDNRLFAPNGPAVLPSSWSTRANHLAQGLVALTSVLSPTAVNDLRFSVFSFQTRTDPATAQDCPGCFGLDAPFIRIPDVGLALGNADSSVFGGRRYQLTDSLVWQREDHRLRFGFEWEHVTNTGVQDAELAQITLWAPARVRQLDPSIPLPAAFTTVDDMLQLPLQSFDLRISAEAFPWRGFRPYRVLDLYRLYVSDTWRAGPRLTINAGLAWSYEPNALNHDLTKPALLTPILGADGLHAPAVQRDTFSPTVGFAWTATGDGKTVVRGGAGRYFDPAASTNFNNLLTERNVLAPLGAGVISAPGSRFGLEFLQRPTAFTGTQLVAMLPALRAELLSTRNPGNRDFSVRNLDFEKTGRNLYDPSYRMPEAIHVGVGVQRELFANFVAAADFVAKRFTHSFINGIDYNRWGSVSGPVIPRCTEGQADDVAAACSNGSMYFDTTIGTARYTGLLVRAEKRFSSRTQFLASYALGSYVGANGTGTATSESGGGRAFGFNNDNWFENYGPLPTDYRHVLSLSGFVELPWQLQVAFSTVAYSRPPFSAFVGGVDFNGDGTRGDLLPGTTVNAFGRGLDNADLEQLVALYNQRYAGQVTAGGQTAPPITLPDDFSLDDTFFTQDVRVSRTFSLGSNGIRLLLLAEVFNLFNTANLVQYSGNLANPATFGQPGGRFSQVFGSGGPRAVQFGARVSF